MMILINIINSTNNDHIAIQDNQYPETAIS